jgi:hypothetical protein
MRLSINRNDRAFKPPHVTKQWRVFLDGKELFDVETADEELGFVIRTWPTRHPVTRKTVMQRSGITRGVVKLIHRDRYEEHCANAAAEESATLASSLELAQRAAKAP